MMIKGISSTLIWICFLQWWSRDLLYFDNLELKWWPRGSLLCQSGFAFCNDDQRDLLYFDNLELKWWSRGSPLPQFGVAMSPVKSQNSELVFNWWVLSSPTIFEMCNFHLLTLDLNFIKKSLTFNFWNLKVLKLLFQILGLWILEIFIWNLELKIWNFEH